MAKIVFIITHGSNSDKSTVAMTVANGAKSAGHEVALFLSSDGVYCAKHGYTDNVSFRPFKPLEELMHTFIENKGVVWACTPCVQHRGLKQEDMVEGTIIVGAGPMIEWLAQGATTVCY